MKSKRKRFVSKGHVSAQEGIDIAMRKDARRYGNLRDTEDALAMKERPAWRRDLDPDPFRSRPVEAESSSVWVWKCWMWFFIGLVVSSLSTVYFLFKSLR